MSKRFYNAAICENGHVLDNMMQDNEHYLYKHCSRCGELVYNVCTECQNPIPGAETNVSWCGTNVKPPYYCPFCGKPYPWTLKILESNQQRLKELDGLDENLKQLLCESLKDIMIESPNTELACDRFKRAFVVAKKSIREILISILAEIACAYVKNKLNI